MTNADHPLSHSIHVLSLPAGGRDVEITATEEERAALAQDFALISCDNLVAKFHVSNAGGPLIAVQGTVEADVVQECSVTLKPVTNAVSADISQVYSQKPDRHGAEIDIEVDDADPPEPLEDGEIDFGALAAEHLALNLDPYPRDPSAQFLDMVESDGVEEERPPGPFAALGALKSAKK